MLLCIEANLILQMRMIKSLPLKVAPSISCLVLQC